MDKKPNLFLIGAMKSGSTTLHELLADHPQICMSDPKEPCYFVEPDLLKEMWPEMWRKGFWRDEQAYLNLFSAKPSAKWRGESSTDYSKLRKVDGVVERLANFSPDARIIYVMRDPVERSISHYWHMMEYRGETRSPLAAIQQDPHYTDVSHYAMQLRPYIERFGLERILLLTFEELTGDPVATIRKVYRWLGVDEEFVPEDTQSARNATPKKATRQREGGGLLQDFRHSELWDRIGGYVPSPVRQLGVNLVEKKVDRAQVDLTPVIEHLRALQQPQVEELVQLVDRDFPDWKTLQGG